MATFSTQLEFWPPLLQQVLQTGTFDAPFNTPTDDLVLTSSDGSVQLHIRGIDLVAGDGRTLAGGTITSFELIHGIETVLQEGNFNANPRVEVFQALLDFLDTGFHDLIYNLLLTNVMFAEGIDAVGDDTNNYFRPGIGPDAFNGLFGSDIVDYVYEPTVNGIEVDISTGFIADAWGFIDQFSHIEEFRGTNQADIFRGASSLTPSETGRYTYTGAAGEDAFFGGFGIDMISYLIDGGDRRVRVDLAQGSATDTHGDTDSFQNIEGVRGTNLGDDLFGDGQDNVFEGMDGADLINGRAGQDLVDYSSETGGHGIVVNLTGDTLRNLTVPGISITDLGPYSARDTYGNIDKLSNVEDINGTFYADHIVGNGARNVVHGDFGNDTIIGNGGNDWLLGGFGDDTIDGGIGDDTLEGGFGNDILNGGNGADILRGDGGNDQLFAGAGNDQMHGGGGDDKLTDSEGKDTFAGNDGADRFDFNKLSEMGNNAATRDVITDLRVFGAPDKIDLASIDANAGVGGDQAFSFVAAPTALFSGAPGEFIWSQEDLAGTADDKTVVSGDVNGDASADFQIELTGLVTLTANDFIL